MIAVQGLPASKPSVRLLCVSGSWWSSGFRLVGDRCSGRCATPGPVLDLVWGGFFGWAGQSGRPVVPAGVVSASMSAAAPLQRGARLRHNEHVAGGTGTKPMIIVGGGEAGGTAAATLREDGFGGPVVIISGEPGIPFGRPPLSKRTCDRRKISRAGTSSLPTGMERMTSTSSSPGSRPLMPQRIRCSWTRAGNWSTRRS